MLILEDLYLGDIHPSERSFKKNSQYAKALNEVVKAGDELIGTLTEKQKEMFEGLHDRPTGGQCVDRLRNLLSCLQAGSQDHDGRADRWEDEGNLSPLLQYRRIQTYHPCHLGARRPLQSATFRAPNCVGWNLRLQRRLVRNLYGTCTVTGQVCFVRHSERKTERAV